MKFDLHMHTSRHSPDADSDPFVLVRAAIAAGLEGIVITEHDYLWTEEELQDLRASEPRLVILAGVEVTGRGGDVLCYGVRDLTARAARNRLALPLPRGTPAGRRLRRGASQPLEPAIREDSPRRKAGTGRHRGDVQQHGHGFASAGDRFDQEVSALSQLGNSDSHQPETVGCCYTDFDAEIRTDADLVAAIRGRKGVARVNDAHRT